MKLFESPTWLESRFYDPLFGKVDTDRYRVFGIPMNMRIIGGALQVTLLVLFLNSAVGGPNANQKIFAQFHEDSEFLVFVTVAILAGVLVICNSRIGFFLEGLVFGFVGIAMFSIVSENPIPWIWTAEFWEMWRDPAPVSVFQATIGVTVSMYAIQMLSRSLKPRLSSPHGEFPS